jgi:hypothetical protein
VERLGRQAVQRGSWWSDDLEKSVSRYIVLYVQCSDLPVRVVAHCRARRTSWGRSSELEPGYPHHARRGRQGRRAGSGSGAERCFPLQGWQLVCRSWQTTTVGIWEMFSKMVMVEWMNE